MRPFLQGLVVGLCTALIVPQPWVLGAVVAIGMSLIIYDEWQQEKRKV